ncbi:hypothetical protein VTK73DRAFT_1214 [Phialemonium thermophilum]|uniref:Uncharacterized protein n=1 Tax=Phialemonium thermophilum TaxID=223376 RepID=A0ABR3VTQ7_9PEZI
MGQRAGYYDSDHKEPSDNQESNEDETSPSRTSSDSVRTGQLIWIDTQNLFLANPPQQSGSPPNGLR